MAQLKLTDVRKSFGSLEVLHGINLEIETGEFVVFVGPSGCGKSTLLRLIAGLEDISGGTLEFDGQVVNHKSPAERGIAMVFQSYALYPHMTVYDNMAFGMKLAGGGKDEIKRRVREAADILQITPYLDRLPKQLSGGQRQRVAIGRAIVRDPRVFLFDEPLSNLDAALRVQTRIEIARLKERMADTTMIYVTHDQVEAMTLADRIVVLRDGYVEQVGSPMDLYHTPANLFVAQFIGSPSMNIVPASARTEAGMLVVEPDGGRKFSLNGAGAGVPDGPVQFGVRPEDLNISGEGQPIFDGPVTLVEQLGESQLIYVERPEAEEPLVVKLAGTIEVKRGERVELSAQSDVIRLFDRKGKAMRL
jgi:alpha-glucoside transport system ATP-binding protein